MTIVNLTHDGIDPVRDVSDPFNAKYGGQCQLDSCDRQRVIEIGDVCQYVASSLVHMVCARRIMRQQAAPLCSECWCYHAGECA